MTRAKRQQVSGLGDDLIPHSLIPHGLIQHGLIPNSLIPNKASALESFLERRLEGKSGKWLVSSMRLGK